MAGISWDYLYLTPAANLPSCGIHGSCLPSPGLRTLPCKGFSGLLHYHHHYPRRFAKGMTGANMAKEAVCFTGPNAQNEGVTIIMVCSPWPWARERGNRITGESGAALQEF